MIKDVTKIIMNHFRNSYIKQLTRLAIKYKLIHPYKTIWGCPNCGDQLMKSYHVGFSAPMRLFCPKCSDCICNSVESTGMIAFELEQKVF